MINLTEKMTRVIENYSHILFDAENSKQEVPPLTEGTPNLTVQDAYQIQLTNVQKKVEEGNYITGKKIGLTSLAMQESLGVSEPDYGHLLDDMLIENGGDISYKRVIQPKVEAEIAFILKKDLKGPRISTLDVLQATECVVPALEIIDSRIRNWDITLPDTIADNASSGFYLLGDKPMSIDQLNLKQTGMALYRNGRLCNTGVGAAALGDPAYCVAWLANKLAEFDITLKAGEIILSGALSVAVSAKPGDFFQARFANIGEVSVRFLP